MSLSPGTVQEAVLAACRADVEVFKPGNVSIGSDAHGMCAEDFLVSAERSAPILVDRRLPVGARILHAVQATRDAVGCNTNLGILLLCAPLAEAALRTERGRLRGGLGAVLRELDGQAEAVYGAIRLAAPGGLGNAPAHDVAEVPRVGLIEAMRAAAHRDRIAHQYASGFEDVFGVGVPALQSARDAGEGEARAVALCYLRFLASFPDSHIARKHGLHAAEGVQQEAADVETQFKACENPPDAAVVLLQFDKKLRRGGMNPGTTADLTVASVLAARLDALLDIGP